jgi:AraC-like DNA-binding protein
MTFPAQADIIEFIKGVIQGIQSYARANQVNLLFSSELDQLEIFFDPPQVAEALTKLVSRVITFTPQKFSVWITVRAPSGKTNPLLVDIQNNGVNLTLMGDIFMGLSFPVQVTGCNEGSNFQLQIPIPQDHDEAEGTQMIIKQPTMIKPWYSEIRKRLCHHFDDPKHLENAVVERDQHNGVFLRKVNLIIEYHLDQEGFTAEVLAQKVAMSRTQLFRKLKDLTQMAPGRYIRFIRLQKAKDLLEKGALNVSEVAYRVGFVSNSHFSRSFHRQFGINPSALTKVNSK